MLGQRNKSPKIMLCFVMASLFPIGAILSIVAAIIKFFEFFFGKSQQEKQIDALHKQIDDIEKANQSASDPAVLGRVDELFNRDHANDR